MVMRPRFSGLSITQCVSVKLERVGTNVLALKVAGHTIFYLHYCSKVMVSSSTPVASHLTYLHPSRTVCQSTFMRLRYGYWSHNGDHVGVQEDEVSDNNQFGSGFCSGDIQCFVRLTLRPLHLFICCNYFSILQHLSCGKAQNVYFCVHYAFATT